VQLVVNEATGRKEQRDLIKAQQLAAKNALKGSPDMSPEERHRPNYEGRHHSRANAEAIGRGELAGAQLTTVQGSAEPAAVGRPPRGAGIPGARVVEGGLPAARVFPGWGQGRYCFSGWMMTKRRKCKRRVCAAPQGRGAGGPATGKLAV